MQNRWAIAMTLGAWCAGCSTSSSPHGGGTVEVTISGEAYGVTGLAFPPTNSAPVIVDGWQIDFDEILVTLDHVTLSENPDLSPTDQSQVGRKVAEADGPWAFDLHKGGPLPGKGEDGDQATLVATLVNQNQNGNRPFDPTVRYAFGFDFIPASATATLVNLGEQAKADYATMIQNRWDSYYVGTATWKGGASCVSSDPTYSYEKLPTQVKFRFGFQTPATYINCQNPDNQPAQPLEGEKAQRGIQIRTNATTVAQVTFHTDHPFFGRALEGEQVEHFDQYAAVAKSVSGSSIPVVTLDDIKGLNPEKLPVPWRSCNGSPLGDQATRMDFDLQGIAYNPQAAPDKALRDYLDFVQYSVGEHGHLNSDGLCYAKRSYPSPP